MARAATALSADSTIPWDADLNERARAHAERMEREGRRVMAAAARDLDPVGFDPDGDLPKIHVFNRCSINPAYLCEFAGRGARDRAPALWELGKLAVGWRASSAAPDQVMPRPGPRRCHGGDNRISSPGPSTC